MTGRAAGYCAGYGAPGFMNPVPGRGFGFGRGRGGFGRGLGLGFRGGRGRGAYPPASYAPPYPVYGPAYGAAPSTEQEAAALRDQVKYFENALDDVKERLAELEENDRQ